MEFFFWGSVRTLFILYSLINPSPDKERDSPREFADEGKGDVDDESDVELDGNDQLDLDLDSEHNDNDLRVRSTLWFRR